MGRPRHRFFVTWCRGLACLLCIHVIVVPFDLCLDLHPWQIFSQSVWEVLRVLFELLGDQQTRWVTSQPCFSLGESHRMAELMPADGAVDSVRRFW
mmetsp:Transcript_22039/g.48311  ORF Transcript_22039/g.48311 Transcript_22039/m.48311 type:complete len:96 (-) Transcript_22039:253-540(-)